MRSYLAILLVITMTGCSSLERPTIAVVTMKENLLTDASFELGEEGALSSEWVIFGNGNKEAIGGRTGEYALKLYGNFTGRENYSGVYQDVAAVPGSSYEASVHIMSDQYDFIQKGNSAWVQLEFYDEDSNLLERYESGRKFSENNSPNTYEKLTTGAVLAPEQSVTARFLFVFFQGEDSPGSAFGDDAALIQL